MVHDHFRVIDLLSSFHNAHLRSFHTLLYVIQNVDVSVRSRRKHLVDALMPYRLDDTLKYQQANIYRLSAAVVVARFHFIYFGTLLPHVFPPLGDVTLGWDKSLVIYCVTRQKLLHM